ETLDPAPDPRLVAVEYRDHVESLRLEPAIGEQRRSDVPGAHDRDPPPAVETEDGADLVPQVRDVVAEPAAPEGTEVGEILPHLRRGDPLPLRQAVGGDHPLPLRVD